MLFVPVPGLLVMSGRPVTGPVDATGAAGLLRSAGWTHRDLTFLPANGVDGLGVAYHKRRIVPLNIISDIGRARECEA